MALLVLYSFARGRLFPCPNHGITFQDVVLTKHGSPVTFKSTGTAPMPPQWHSGGTPHRIPGHQPAHRQHIVGGHPRHLPAPQGFNPAMQHNGGHGGGGYGHHGGPTGGGGGGGYGGGYGNGGGGNR